MGERKGANTAYGIQCQTDRHRSKTILICGREVEGVLGKGLLWKKKGGRSDPDSKRLCRAHGEEVQAFHGHRVVQRNQQGDLQEVIGRGVPGKGTWEGRREAIGNEH